MNSDIDNAINALERHLDAPSAECELCKRPGGDVLWEDDLCRVIAVNDHDYPGFCRVIAKQHVAEMSDLDPASRLALMRVVFAVETALRQTCHPDKINLASLGNQTPHVHWHVIPRWRNDRHFPQPIWGVAQRPNSPKRALPPAYTIVRALREALAASGG